MNVILYCDRDTELEKKMVNSVYFVSVKINHSLTWAIKSDEWYLLVQAISGKQDVGI